MFFDPVRHATEESRLFQVAFLGGENVPKSVVDAIKMGFWNFEPELVEETGYSATGAIPGSREKIEILAARAQEGLPLWHNDDRNDYDDRLG